MVVVRNEIIQVKCLKPTWLIVRSQIIGSYVEGKLHEDRLGLFCSVLYF